MKDVEGHWFTGESKGGPLAANTSLVVGYFGVFARVRARDRCSRGRARGRVEISRGGQTPGGRDGRDDGTNSVRAQDLEPRSSSGSRRGRNSSARATRRRSRTHGRRASMSGGAKVTWSPHTCAYNRKRSLFFITSLSTENTNG